MRGWLVVAISVLAACSDPDPGAVDAPASPIDATAADAPAVIDAIPPDAAPAMLQGILTYIKATNTAMGDGFGSSVALSGDGNTLAVGASREDSAATGIDGDQTDNGAPDSGAVYIYTRDAGAWTPSAYIKPLDTFAGDGFGWRVALSHDGDTLAVSALYEQSCATGIDGPDGLGCGGAGAAYVFVRDAGAWSQQAYVKPSNTRQSLEFGVALALSRDGATLAVGAPGEPSAATGIDGNQTSITATLAGAVYVFARTGTTWSQQAYVKASNTQMYDVFGVAVALSADGDVMAVGATGEDSGATGVGGTQIDNSVEYAGAVYVFARAGTAWAQTAYAKASNTGQDDQFGYSVALSADGTSLAVGAYGEDSAATGVDGDQSDNSELNAGAVYAFANVGDTWTQQGYLKELESANNDTLGISLAMSADGSTIVAGAPSETGGGTGITTPQGPDVNNSGATYVWRRSGTTWAVLYYIKASNPGEQDVFGGSVATSDDASVLAISASFEDGAATGVGGDETSEGASAAGAVYAIE